MTSGTCHCGNITLQVKTLPDTLTQCNCSHCFRTAPLYGYYTSPEVDVIVTSGVTDGYEWGDRMIHFHHCPIYKIHTHYTATDKAGMDRVGVNFRLFDREMVESIRVRRFDGADTWTFLD
ncbi:GFA family protein [Vibrio penaeicida]|uniref:CENP-V/GFA domain-containing protein n=1 Tax=Vibrio penaeicida TaxID=104609 RepID=A0AAV5P0N4_9VIBR|nr:aldehyde-activating protein [Vibrio penaeicida]RTZ22660.1 aldehyde-activating protein [Vibrio penaeicida]GLQ76197.1 hypothetical protein GCM10007932_55600 [Vibrio penaeicida]